MEPKVGTKWIRKETAVYNSSFKKGEIITVVESKGPKMVYYTGQRARSHEGFFETFSPLVSTISLAGVYNAY